MTDILEETRAAVALLCGKMDRGEINESDRAALRLAMDLMQQGGLGDTLLGGSIVCSIADQFIGEQLPHHH